MAWQEAKDKAKQIYEELLQQHDHGYCGMVLNAMQRLHTRARPAKRITPIPDAAAEEKSQTDTRRQA